MQKLSAFRACFCSTGTPTTSHFIFSPNAASLAANGVKNIVMHNVSKSPASYVLKDIFKYKGLIIGSPTYSNRLFPEIESILDKIETREVKHRLYGYFGSFTWAGAAVKNLAAFNMPKVCLFPIIWTSGYCWRNKRILPA